MRKLLWSVPLVFFALLVSTAGPAHAGIANPDFQLNPQTGPEGTTVIMTPLQMCPNYDTYINTYAGVSTVPNPTEADFLDAQPLDGSGMWQLSVTIPPGTPVGPITYYVECRGENPLARAGTMPLGLITFATYNPQTFNVTATTTTTTTAPTTTTTAPATTTTAPATTTTTVAAAITVSPIVIAEGGTGHVSGSGFMPGSNVEASLHSTPVVIGTLVADSGGNVSTNFTIPLGFGIGSHVVQLDGIGTNGQALQLAADITVTVGAQAATTTTVYVGTLPTTGSDSTQPAIMIAMVLIGTGAAVVLVTRRVRSTR